MRAALVAALLAGARAASTSPIKYIIVLMMENRSFDHLLGHLGLTDSRIDGVTTAMGNPADPASPSGPFVNVNFDAVDTGPVDPLHDFDSITFQVFGSANPAPNAVPQMNGFAYKTPKGPNGQQPMDFVLSAFNASSLPVLSMLATEYAVFDHWHCSSPTPTNPNREFLMSGTSNGYTVNTIPDAGFPQETHFHFLERHNISWGGYFTDDGWMFPTFQDLRTPSSLAKIKEMPSFFADLEAGTLPQYVLLEPRMATSATGPSNWQHPDNSIEAGEQLIAEIYTALRSSSIWNESLFIITYDEHGGFFDHQKYGMSTADGVPPPDSVPGDNGFKFDRLGVRVPTVMVSPWIAKGTVVNAPSAAQQPTPTSKWDATSIISTANKIFGIPAGESLTKRDAWAATFLDLVDGTSSPLRTDCPATLPKPRPLSEHVLAAELVQPLNDHHLDSLNLLCHLSGQAHPACVGFPGGEAARDAYAAGLGAASRTVPAWTLHVDYPHLHAGVAPLLQQQHFEAVSKAMWGTWKASVMGGASTASA